MGSTGVHGDILLCSNPVADNLADGKENVANVLKKSLNPYPRKMCIKTFLKGPCWLESSWSVSSPDDVTISSNRESSLESGTPSVVSIIESEESFVSSAEGDAVVLSLDIIHSLPINDRPETSHIPDRWPAMLTHPARIWVARLVRVEIRAVCLNPQESTAVSSIRQVSSLRSQRAHESNIDISV